MLSSINHPSWLFFLPLAQQASLLKDDLLDPVDDLLNDEELVALVRQCLATRYPESARTGRPGMAPDRLLRCCVLKHLKGWSFRELERELCSNLLYRRFTHYDAKATCSARLHQLPSLVRLAQSFRHPENPSASGRSGVRAWRRSGAQVKKGYHRPHG